MNTREAAKNLLKVLDLIDNFKLDQVTSDWEYSKAIADLEKSLEKEPSAEVFLKEKGIAFDMNVNTCTKKPPKIKLSDLLNEYRNL